MYADFEISADFEMVTCFEVPVVAVMIIKMKKDPQFHFQSHFQPFLFFPRLRFLLRGSRQAASKGFSRKRSSSETRSSLKQAGCSVN